MIAINDISVTFGTHHVLKKLNFQINEGEIIGLVAPNGTGKSTLLNVLMNYVRPTSGTVAFDDLTYQTPKAEKKIHEQITMLPDQGDLYNFLSGRDHLEIYQKMWHKTSISPSQVIETLQMSGYIDKKVSAYSLGMRQRLCFAMQIVANTPYMLMDEVMNGLDPTNVELLSKVLVEKRAEGKAIVIASHLLENLSHYSDRVFFLKDGIFINEIKKDVPSKQVIKFTLPEKNLTQINGQKITTLPNGVSFISHNETQIAAILQELHNNGIYEFSIGPISLSDFYSMYFE
ncbi:ABC transporter ATP-binding protein [Enterococcus mediterraneensis]|uniref:ABC transporter ATP-binding protein n=1 Tax=Enterococcus mediterraneensis TaxID=2364791 RepID=UPI000F04F153|nr:ABC transporter ATP-binding protein [Enterococcus mediterraneensis]